MTPATKQANGNSCPKPRLRHGHGLRAVPPAGSSANTRATCTRSTRGLGPEPTRNRSSWAPATGSCIYSCIRIRTSEAGVLVLRSVTFSAVAAAGFSCSGGFWGGCCGIGFSRPSSFCLARGGLRLPKSHAQGQRLPASLSGPAPWAAASSGTTALLARMVASLEGAVVVPPKVEGPVVGSVVALEAGGDSVSISEPCRYPPISCKSVSFMNSLARSRRCLCLLP
mmetsp:Transcript_56518/g.175647  ORF Transcript_56518/g.175647 Transcript_56518/m.175647 type:complete len:225 (+) Transcript_56518:109-783(+)